MAVALLVGGCGSNGGPSAAASVAASPATSGEPTPVGSPPSAAAFWAEAARALSVTQRLRVIVVDGMPNELRYEPRASAALDRGELRVVCVDRQAYDIDGFRARERPASWACGSSALVSSFRRTGRPLEAWNSTLPTDDDVRELVVADGRDRWRWDYTATSRALGGLVTTTLLMDAATGRLLSGNRTDPTGSVRWTFNYTQIFSPVELP
jgi:hypothetical protein